MAAAVNQCLRHTWKCCWWRICRDGSQRQRVPLQRDDIVIMNGSVHCQRHFSIQNMVKCKKWKNCSGSPSCISGSDCLHWLQHGVPILIAAEAFRFVASLQPFVKNLGVLKSFISYCIGYWKTKNEFDIFVRVGVALRFMWLSSFSVRILHLYKTTRAMQKIRFLFHLLELFTAVWREISTLTSNRLLQNLEQHQGKVGLFISSIFLGPSSEAMKRWWCLWLFSRFCGGRFRWCIFCSMKRLGMSVVIEILFRRERKHSLTFVPIVVIVTLVWEGKFVAQEPLRPFPRVGCRISWFGRIHHLARIIIGFRARNIGARLGLPFVKFVMGHPNPCQNSLLRLDALWWP